MKNRVVRLVGAVFFLILTVSSAVGADLQKSILR